MKRTIKFAQRKLEGTEIVELCVEHLQRMVESTGHNKENFSSNIVSKQGKQQIDEEIQDLKKLLRV